MVAYVVTLALFSTFPTLERVQFTSSYERVLLLDDSMARLSEDRILLPHISDTLLDYIHVDYVRPEVSNGGTVAASKSERPRRYWMFTYSSGTAKVAVLVNTLRRGEESHANDLYRMYNERRVFARTRSVRLGESVLCWPVVDQAKDIAVIAFDLRDSSLLRKVYSAWEVQVKGTR